MHLTGTDDQKLPPGLGTLGGRIRAVREASGKTVGEAAKTAGVSRTQFSQWQGDHVKNPVSSRLGAFAAAHQVSLDWLLNGNGPPPLLMAASGATEARPKRKSDPASEPGAADMVTVPEISPFLSAHAREIDRTPRALWVIPRDVLALGFRCEPSAAVMQRIQTAFGPLPRDAYVIIDTQRNAIDEPGIYLLANEAGPSARRVEIPDGVSGEVAVNGDTVLGRVMGVFNPL